jgi:hypothetical protein
MMLLGLGSVDIFAKVRLTQTNADRRHFEPE